MRFNLRVTTFHPMLLAPASELPCRAGTVYEPKIDGMRAIVSIAAGKVHVASRHGRNWTASFPELAVLGSVADAVLDGELAVLSPHGRPDFSLLQSRLATRDTAAHLSAMRLPATYYAFDLVHLGDQDLCPQPWTIRRAALEDLELATRTGGELLRAG
jgi:bifunctional non-homologous end joining protein LigD